MKKILSVLSLILVVGGMIFTSCTKKYTITVKSSNEDWGTVTGGGSYVVNSKVTLTAIPKDGYAFLKWDDGNSENPRSFAVTADATYTAVFMELPTEHGVNVTFNGETWESEDIYAEYDPNDKSWFVDAYRNKDVEFPSFSMRMYKSNTGITVSSVNSEGELTNADFGWIEYYKNTAIDGENNVKRGDYWAKMATVSIYEFDPNALVFSAEVTATMFSALEAFVGVDGNDPVGVDAASTAPMTVTMTKVQMVRNPAKRVGTAKHFTVK